MNSQRGSEPLAATHERAMEWRLRHEEGDLSPEDREAFAAWLTQSEKNRAAYEGLEKFWAVTGAIDRHGAYASVLRRTEATVQRGRLTRRALAASLAAAFLGLSGWGLHEAIGPKALVDQSFRTGIGQQAAVTLPDGSQVTLNTDTVVRTRADGERRLVYLDKGQAFFKVAKDRRHPFVVAAAGRTVTALGTAFDVRVEGGGLKVVLVEGKVRVETAKTPLPARGPSRTRPVSTTGTDMSAGSQLVSLDNGEWRITPTNVDLQTSWTKGQLVFEGAPLREVVDELNRYSTRKIELADPALGARRVGGNFTPGDVQGFARILAAAGIANLEEQPDGRILVVASKANS